MSFATSAHALLVDRSWADVQRLARDVATPFHEASGLTVLVGLGWRVALDQKNRRHTQATTYFVFDGPATSTHLDQLDSSMQALPLDFGTGSVERVPANGVHAVLLSQQEAVLPVDTSPDGTHWFRRLEVQDGQVRSRRQAVSQAGADELDRSLDPRPAVVPPLSAADRETERMRLAFALHYATRIVEADGIVHDDEEAFLASVFPESLVERLGLSDPRTREEYLQAATQLLASRLGHHDKLALVGLFFSACYADGSLDAREMRVLKNAGDRLGLQRDEVVKYLRRFW